MLVATLDRTEVPAGSFYLPEDLRFLSERLSFQAGRPLPRSTSVISVV